MGITDWNKWMRDRHIKIFTPEEARKREEKAAAWQKKKEKLDKRRAK